MVVPYTGDDINFFFLININDGSTCKTGSSTYKSG